MSKPKKKKKKPKYLFSSKEESDLFMKNENENTWIRIQDQQCNIWVSRNLSSLTIFLFIFLSLFWIPV